MPFASQEIDRVIMPSLTLQKRILLLDASVSIAALFQSYLVSLDIVIDIPATRLAGLNALSENDYDAVILNLSLTDAASSHLLTQITQLYPVLPVMVIGTQNVIELAEVVKAGVGAIKAEAIKVISLPTDAATLCDALCAVLQIGIYARECVNKQHFQGFIGSSAEMQAIYQLIGSAAPSKATVFITGESGTGKEVCAEALHALSGRENKPFVAINCAAVPRELIESELFGHVKGAFTGAASHREGAVEQADGGTLFLDEIGEMDVELQAKLLRFIQTGSFQKVGSSTLQHVDVRFICATNRDPWREVQLGHFREDLYYRLHVIPITLPPLRARGNDIIEIANELLIKFAKEEQKQFRSFHVDVLQHFMLYSWPGNVRQLQNVIRNIVVLHQGSEVLMSMLPAPIAQSALPAVETTSPFIPQANNTAKRHVDLFPTAFSSHERQLPRKTDIEPLWRVEQRAILAAISLCDGHVPQAAGLLEVSPSTLYRKLQSWKLAAKKNV